MSNEADQVAAASAVARTSQQWLESEAGVLAALAPNLSADAARAVAATPAELLQRWIDSLSAPVRAAYGRHLSSFCRWTVADESEVPGAAMALQLVVRLGCRDLHQVVRGWRDHLLASGLASGTVAGAVSAVGSLVRAAKDAGLIEWTLERCAPRVEQRQDRRGPVRGEVERLFAHLDALAAEGDALAARDVALVALLHNAGLRRQEALQLQVADVELGAVALVVTRRKGFREKTRVRIGTLAGERLERWLRIRGSEPGAIFCRIRQASSKAVPMTGESCRRMLRTRSLEAGIKSPVRPHGLRHSSASEVLRRGSLLELQAFGQWRTLSAAAHYIDIRAETRQRAIELVEV